MPFVDPSRRSEDDALPGSGLHVDLDTRVCPSCRREAPPWQARCPDCGVATVAPTELPPTEVELPGLLDPEPHDPAEGEPDPTGAGRDAP